MDSNEFLSYFWELSDKHTNEQITKAAEGIVNLVDAKQKFEKGENEIDKIKYKLYLELCEKPTQDLLYTFKRLIGGISSIGVEYRRGFLLTFSLLLSRFGNIVNLRELIRIIGKESNVSKSEKQHIKNCATTGHLLMIRALLNSEKLTFENFVDILRIFNETLKNGTVQEATLFALDTFIKNLVSGYYVELNMKKVCEKILNFVDSTILSKVNPKSIIDYSLIFLLAKHSQVKKNSVSLTFENYLPKNILENMTTETLLVSYLKLLLNNKLRDNDFHISFTFFTGMLKHANFSIVYKIWNALIDHQNAFKNISSKNYQQLIIAFSKFILENHFDLKYVKEIFDFTFFENVLKFVSKHKFKYLNSLIEIIQHKLAENASNELTPEYCFNLLNIFGYDPTISISPQSYKAFFNVLFNNLTSENRDTFLENLINDDDSDDLEEYQYKTNVLKLLLTNSDVAAEVKEKILNSYIQTYLNYNNVNFEIQSLLEDRTLASILFIVNDKKVSKYVKNLCKIHKDIQSMIGDNKVTVEPEEFKMYKKHYAKIAKLIKDEDCKTKSHQLLYVLYLVLLILFMKDAKEYSEVLEELLEIAEFKQDWEKVLTDLCLSLIHKGNSSLSELTMHIFKKFSKQLGKDSVDVLLEFLNEEKGEEDIEMLEDI